MIWNQLGELQRWQRRMGRLFEELPAGEAAEFPAINLWSGDPDYVMVAELPGVDPSKIDITVVGDTVTLRGTREESALGEGEIYHRRERGFGQFVRSVKLPTMVDLDKVEARYERGLLQVRLPRAETSRPRKISLKSS